MVSPSRLPYLLRLVTAFTESRNQVEDAISSSLDNWRLDRLSVMDRGILRLGTTEILFLEDLPGKVAIQEAVRLAERYGGTDSPRFVNRRPRRGVSRRWGPLKRRRAMPARRRLRILVVNWQDRCNPSAGGAEEHLHQVFGSLARRGHRVTLLCSGWDRCDPTAEIDGIRVHRTGRRYTFNLAAPFCHERRFRGERFDVVVEDLNKVPMLSPVWAPAPVHLLLVHHLFGTTAFREAKPGACGCHLALRTHHPVRLQGTSLRRGLGEHPGGPRSAGAASGGHHRHPQRGRTGPSATSRSALPVAHDRLSRPP